MLEQANWDWLLTLLANKLTVLANNANTKIASKLTVFAQIRVCCNLVDFTTTDFGDSGYTRLKIGLGFSPRKIYCGDDEVVVVMRCFSVDLLDRF